MLSAALVLTTVAVVSGIRGHSNLRRDAAILLDARATLVPILKRLMSPMTTRTVLCDGRRLVRNHGLRQLQLQPLRFGVSGLLASHLHPLLCAARHAIGRGAAIATTMVTVFPQTRQIRM